MKLNPTKSFLAAGFVSGMALAASQAQAVFFHVGSGSIDGSLCVGLDCVSSPSFGFTTLLMMENNLRLKFDDTSSSASFPNQDWSLEANESSNGGRNAFFLRNCGVSSQGNCSGNAVFTAEAGARNNALYVEDDGDIGIGTSTPAVDVDIKTGNTPTVRLQQDGTSGFTPQTWDMAGNETNFFIRDATGGSTLPFRVRPGAPTSAIDVAGSGNVGIGTSSPSNSLHVRRTDGTAKILVEEASGTAAARGLLELSNNDTVYMTLKDTGAGGETWNVQSNAGELRFTNATGPGIEMRMTTTGDMTIAGEITTSGSCSGGCDLVFDESYDLPSIADHAEQMFANNYLPNVGPTAEEGPFNLSDKVLSMLNELETAHIYIAQLNEIVAQQNDVFAAQNVQILDLQQQLDALQR